MDFNARNCRIPCFPHVINIITQHIFKALKDGIGDDLDLPDPDDNNNNNNGDGVEVDDDDTDNENDDHDSGAS
jgi:hypothetical protein